MTRDDKVALQLSSRRMLSRLGSTVRSFYFVRWLRLRSLGDLEKARSTTPITRHTNPKVISIVIFSPSSSPSPARRSIRSAAPCASLTNQPPQIRQLPRIRELQVQYLALVNQLMINIDRNLFYRRPFARPAASALIRFE